MYSMMKSSFPSTDGMFLNLDIGILNYWKSLNASDGRPGIWNIDDGYYPSILVDVNKKSSYPGTIVSLFLTVRSAGSEVLYFEFDL